MEKILRWKGVILIFVLLINTQLLAQQFEKLPVITPESQRTGRSQIQRMPVWNEAQPVNPGSTISPQNRSAVLFSGGSDVLVNNNTGATGISHFTQSETSIVAFGNNVVIGYNDAGSNAGGANKFTGWSYSSNNGVSFTDGGTLPTNAIGDAGDPLLARNDNTGRIYFATLGFNNSNVIQVFRSDDNGVTWMLPVNGTPGGNNEDKPWLTVDNNDGPGNGNVYILSRRFGAGPGIYFYRSTDHGATYSTGTLIVSNMQGAFITVSPDHSIHAFWYNGPNIMVRRSTDFGASFGAPVTVATGLVGGVNGNLNLTGIRQGTATPSTFRTNEFPHAFANPVSGHLYVTYNNDGPGSDKADVLMVMSTDAGATWSVPVKVNDDITTTDQWMPTIAVSPDGLNLGIFYYSRQEDALNNNLFKYYGRIGSIVGSTVTFSPSFAVSDVASLPEFGRDNIVNSVYMGDYNQVAATPNAFHIVWSDNRDDLSGGAPRKDPNVYYDQILLVPPVDPTVFYSKAAGDLHNLATWGVNPDGSGTNPANFGAGKTFNLVNRAGIYSMTGSWTVEGLIVNTLGSQLQINGFNLAEAGMTGGGTITGSPASTLRVIGTSGGEAGPLAFTAGGRTLNHFLLNRTGPGSSATLITPLEIYGTFGADNGTFNTGDMLTLNSDAAGTARVLPLPSGAVNGQVTVERYIPARRAWRILTAPISGGQTIFQSWQENRNNTMPDPNPFPGFGTHITGGPVFGSPANGFDQNPGSASSIKFYNSASDAWSPLPNTNATMPALTALMLFVRGDRGIALGPDNVPAVPTTLRAKGPLVIGNVVFGVNATGFTAVPNPYASPVDFALLGKANVQNSAWFWDPKMGGINGVGAYVNVSFNGTTWDVTPTPVSPISQIIQSGQGFLVKSAGGVPGTLAFSESSKSATPAQDVFRTVKTSGIRVSLHGVNDDQSTDLLDEFFSSYSSSFSSKIDQMDASKPGNIEENIAIENSDELLMVERRPELSKEDQIRIRLWNTKERTYALELNPVNLGTSGLTAWMIDHYTQNVSQIPLDNITKFNFVVGKDAASADPRRFSIIISEKRPEPRQNLLTGIRVYPNPVINQTINLQFNNQQAGSYQVRLVNSIGQVVFSRKVQYDGGYITQKLRIEKYPKGIYQLEISGGGKKTNLQLMNE